MGQNQLSGPIPKELGVLRNLVRLGLKHNQLTGEIPAALGSLIGLAELTLAYNQLTGPLPAALGSLSLWTLWLDENQLSGSIGPAISALHDRGGSLVIMDAGLPDCPPECPRRPLYRELCENGTVVASPGENLELVHDCIVLLRLREPLAGDAMLNWDGSRPITAWEGITIGGDPPRVVALALPSRGLTGHVSPRLGRLVGLRGLELADNHLIGPIPLELGALGSLVRMELHGNRLFGPIPPTLGGLRRLESLHLNDNQLSGAVPAALGYLAALQSVSLRGNPRLAGCLPPALRNATDNDIADTGLPDCPPPVPPAELCVNGTAVPSPGDNPGLLGDCTVLLTAESALAGDATLDWDADRPMTEWEGVTIGGAPPRVQGLELWTRDLTGHIPPELGGLSGLRTLALGENHLSGPIPVELGGLVNLRELSLSVNYLSGAIPGELGALANLERLYLYGNHLSGVIPGTLGTLPRLEVLWLGSNDLSGPIPTELGGLVRLRELVLSNNMLSGGIPGELGRLTDLSIVDLHENQLSGPIPEELGGLRNLYQMWLDWDRFTGPLPEELGNVHRGALGE